MYKGQLDRDEKIRTLVLDIDSFYLFALDRAKANCVAGQWPKLYKKIQEQTVECCYFIDRYACDKFGAQCSLPTECRLLIVCSNDIAKKVVKHVFSRVDDIIEKFRDVFNELKERFDRDVAVQTELVSIRVLGLVEITGKRSYKLPRN